MKPDGSLLPSANKSILAHKLERMAATWWLPATLRFCRHLLVRRKAELQLCKCFLKIEGRGRCRAIRECTFNRTLAAWLVVVHEPVKLVELAAGLVCCDVE